MKIGILGGGFGIYGYSPAIYKLEHQVITLEKYKKSYLDRIELNYLANSITFVEDENAVFTHSEALVLARIPSSVIALKEQIMDYPGHLFLEKPLGASADQQESIISLLKHREGSFSVAYLARFTPWYQKIRNQVSANEVEINLHWFLTPPKGGWKIETEQGGGTFSYYAIHFLELFIDCGLDLKSIVNFKNTPDSFSIQAKNSICTLNILVELSSTNSFEVKLRDVFGVKSIYESESPFGARGEKGILDPRVPTLSRYLERSLTNPNTARCIEVEENILRIRRLIER